MNEVQRASNNSLEGVILLPRCVCVKSQDHPASYYEILTTATALEASSSWGLMAVTYAMLAKT